MLFSGPVFVGYAATSQSHLELADAADWAVFTTNMPLLKALFDAGVQINVPINDDGDSLLTKAVYANNEKMVDFLLKNGADREHKNALNYRLIDIAFEHGQTNICRLLARNNQWIEKNVEGMPCEMLEYLLRPAGITNVVFVEINQQAPSSAMLSFLREFVWRNARALPKHLKEQYADPKVRPITLQEDEKNSAFVAAQIKKVKDDKYDVWIVIYHQLPRRVEGELLEAVPLHYRAFRHFGYWMIEDCPIAKDKGHGDVSGSK